MGTGHEERVMLRQDAILRMDFVQNEHSKDGVSVLPN
jgi:hypothetical protein